MADFLKDKSLKYLNKDFDSFKRDLIEHTKAHFSGVFQNFNEASPGMALLEMNAFVGDVLSFYIDQQFGEIKMESARQQKNVAAFARSLGYNAKGNRAATGQTYLIVEVPSTTNAEGRIVPNELYSPIIRKGAQLFGPDGVVFETVDNVFMSSSIDRDVTGSRFDNTTGLPTHFAIRKPADIIAGETKEDSVVLGDFEQFRTIELENENVIEIISVVDSEGNEWSEVDYLAQDAVFDSSTNTEDDSDDVPYILKLVTVPRRFIKVRDPETNKMSLIFGSGDGLNFDDELVPNLADYSLPLAGRKTFTTFALDPQNFLKTRSLGLSPFNTTLTINYRVGGGQQTNVPPGSIRSIAATMDFTTTNLDVSAKSDVEASLETVNLTETDGGGPPETISEIKANAGAYFAAQNRIVTRDDFIVRTRSLPEKFGKVDKVFPKRSNVNPLAVDLHILSKDSNGHMKLASQNLKKNIKTYLSQFRMLTDGINLLDGRIINLKLDFGVVVSSKFNRSEVLAKCLQTAKEYLDINKREIGQPIFLSDLSAELQAVYGVVSVYELKFSNLIGSQDGLNYSTIKFDVEAHTNNNIIYCPDDAIIEIKFPNRDISGVAK